MRIRKGTALLVSLALSASLVGCSAPSSMHMDGGRDKLYSDVESIAADSSTVVAVEVVGQEVVKEDIPYTISTVKVLESFSPSKLATNLEAKVVKPTQVELQVRQMGTSEFASLPAPLLKVGSTYLLFLTPSMLEGAAAEQFYVTGGPAGIFTADDGSFARVESDDGDTLPRLLSAEQLSG